MPRPGCPCPFSRTLAPLIGQTRAQGALDRDVIGPQRQRCLQMALGARKLDIVGYFMLGVADEFFVVALDFLVRWFELVGEGHGPHRAGAKWNPFRWGE